MIIYRAINKNNGKCYVGKTVNSLQQRINSHKSESNLNRYDVAFHRALRKYGIDMFEWEVLHECYLVEQLNEMERYFIKKFDSYLNGYNETLGGDGQSIGYVAAESTRKKLSIKSTELWKDLNHRKKVSEIQKARWVRNRHKIIEAQKAWASSPKAVHIKSINAKKMWQKKGHKENMRKKLNKTWEIVLEDGRKFTINDLTKWCERHNINRFTFYGYKDKNKSWKGYFLKSVGE
jgi:group I intron endonuclease